MGKSKILLRFTLVTWEGLGGCGGVSEIMELGIGGVVIFLFGKCLGSGRHG